MQEYKLSESVYWVGDVDFNLHIFHKYSTSRRGTTYNAYFIDDEKKTLIDTVSHGHSDALCTHLDARLKGAKLNYVIAQHMEKDHAGSLPHIVERYKPDVVFCSKLGLKSMQGQFDTTGWNIKTVEDGETLELGKRKVTFFETRMLHWPDSMVTYLHDENVLFTNDIFGQNIASSTRYIDETDRSIVYYEMKYYYANIVLPYSDMAIKALEKIKGLNVPIDIIAPDHGLIFRRKEDIEFLFKCYTEFATQKFKKAAVIAYDTMWRATQKMAHVIGEELYKNGIPYFALNVQENHVADIMNYLMDASVLLLGSSTRNNLPMTGMVALVNHIKGLAPKNKYGAAFGSHGWSGEAPKILTEEIKKMKMPVLAEPLRILYGVDKKQIEECKEFARKIAKEVHAVDA